MMTRLKSRQPVPGGRPLADALVRALRMLHRGRALVLAALAAASLDACDGSDGGPGGSTGPGGSIALAVTPASLTLVQGGSGDVTLTLTRGGGFSGAVSLSAEGLPSGVTATIAPATLTGATTSAVVTVRVAAGVAPGVYTALLRAVAQGVSDATVSYTLTVSAAPDYTLSLMPTTLSVQQGATGAVSVTLARTNFGGTVSLSLDTPPAGLSGTFTPVAVSANTAALVVAVGPSVAPGSYTLTVRGTATGLSDRTATLALTVTAAPSIAITITPPGVVISQGGSGEVTVAITRTNVTGLVTLATSGAPSGLSLAFDQNPTASGQVRLSFSATGQTTVGTYTITVTAQAPNAQVVTATFTIQVQAAVGNQVEFQFCSASENPVFFAARDGGGAWQVVTSTVSASVYRYRFTLTQAVGGVFYVQQSGSALVAGGTSRVPSALAYPGRLASRAVADAVARLLPGDLPQLTTAVTYESTAYFATVPELIAIGTESCAATVSTKSVWMQVAGVGNGQEATLSLGGVTEFFDGDVGLSPVQFTGVRPGLIDFFGVRSSSLTGVPNRLYDVRNLNPADGSTLPFTADFNSANGYDPASAQITIGNALGDDLLNVTMFHTANGDGGMLGGGLAPSTAITRTWYGIPTNKLVAGDVHANVVFASPAVTSTDEQRYHFQFSTTVQNLSPVLGSRLPTQAATNVTSSGYRRVRVQGALPAEYNDLVVVEYGPSGGGNEVWLIATGGYLAATGSLAAYDLSTPDVGALPGFPIASAPSAGEWEVVVGVNGWSGTGILEPVPVSGAIFLGASKQVKLTMP